MWGLTHEEAVSSVDDALHHYFTSAMSDHTQTEVIKNSGNTVTLHTGKLQLKDMGTAIKIFFLWVVLQFVCYFISKEEQHTVDKIWLKMITIPLKMASVTRYKTGTAILRQAMHLFV